MERKLLFLGLCRQRLLLHDDEQTVMKTLAVQLMGQRSQAYIVHKCTGTALNCTYHIARSSVCTACLWLTGSHGWLASAGWELGLAYTYMPVLQLGCLPCRFLMIIMQVCISMLSFENSFWLMCHQEKLKLVWQWHKKLQSFKFWAVWFIFKMSTSYSL